MEAQTLTKTYRTIVVPLDGSRFAEQALPFAVGVARRQEAVLHVVHVANSLLPDYATVPSAGTVFDAARIEGEIRTSMITYLEGVRLKLETESDLQVVAAVIDGTAGDATVQYAKAHAADLVVIATHGRGGMNRAWLGSVAEWIVRHVHAPVLLVRPGESEDSPELEFKPPSTVLVPVLEADFSEAILPHAHALAAMFSAQLQLLNVVIPLELRHHIPEPRFVDDDEELVKAAAYRAQKYLDMISNSLVPAFPNVTTRVEVAASAAEAIQRIADESPASVIAMATHARRGVARLLFGSVADKVVRSTSGCVLLFRPD